MAETTPIVERVNAIASRIAAEHGVEVVHAEVAGTKRDPVVRIFIDKDGGVTLDDCSRFSAATEAVLDAEDPIPSGYVLEISSPGIERSLYSLADFARFAGEMAKVKTTSAIGEQKNFIGRIEGVEGDDIRFDDRTSGKVVIPYSTVEKANLKIDLGREFKRR